MAKKAEVSIKVMTDSKTAEQGITKAVGQTIAALNECGESWKVQQNAERTLDVAACVNLQAHRILTDGVPFFLQGDHGMKYAYASKTGHVEKIVRKLGLADALKIIDGTETVDEDYILFTYTTGKGTPKNR